MEFKSPKKFTLLERLEAEYPESSKNTLRSWVTQGRIHVDGKKITRAQHLVGETEEVGLGAKPKFARKGLKILFEDQDLVVIDKPAGLLSVATPLEPVPSAHDLLKRRYNTRRVYPIHRLDRETEGLLVFAYTEQARDHLKEQLENRSIKREYRAIVHGHPGSGTWRSYLREEVDLFVRVCLPHQGKEAITHFETIQKRKNSSLLHLKLETGRKHQIRVQAAEAGCPIYGDQKYGLEEDKKKLLKLQAVSLTFEHPRTGKQLHFTK
jgi:23S rRNA pseudouridine1911/1915/1917 synthase